MSNVIAIMQPYIFPYIGYMNLVQAANIFVFYDDVNFKKSGWVNRNRILLDGSPFTFTVPLESASSFRFISDTHTNNIQRFSIKFKKQVSQSYRNSRYYSRGMDYITETLDCGSDSIGTIAAASVRNFFDILGVSKKYLVSSTDFASTIGLGRAERLIAIITSLGANEYVNAIGGMELYSKDYFKEFGINLHFIKPRLMPYTQQGSNGFHQGLSVIDMMMNLSLDQVEEHLTSYDIV